MERATVKGFGGVFPNLIAAICVLSCIVGAAYIQADSPITLLSATATESETPAQSALSESGIKPESKPRQPSSTTDNPANNSEPDPKRDIGRLGTPVQSSEWQIVQMRVTAYCPCPKCCGEYSDGVTACGHEIQPGDVFVAADKRYPFRTEMIIPRYNDGQPVKVLDRGGAIRGNRLDVFFASHQEALEWGVRNLDVKVHRE
ncbi:MAG: 3D domain-containing protein [Planctomycetota bacterium]